VQKVKDNKKMVKTIDRLIDLQLSLSKQSKQRESPRLMITNKTHGEML
jgi:hypothetical protein